MKEINRITTIDRLYHIVARVFKNSFKPSYVQEYMTKVATQLNSDPLLQLYNSNTNQCLNAERGSMALGLMSYLGALTHFSTVAGMEIESDNAAAIAENIEALIENNKLSKNQLVSLEGFDVIFEPTILFKLQPNVSEFEPDAEQWYIGENGGGEQSYIKTTNEWTGNAAFTNINKPITELSKSVFGVRYSDINIIEMCFRLTYWGDVQYFSGYVCQIINEETGESGPVVPMIFSDWFGGRIGASKNKPEEVLSLSSFPEGYRRIDLLPGHTWVIKFWKDDSPQKNFTIKQTSNITGVKTSVSVSGDNKTIGDGSTVFKYRAYPDVLMVSRVTHVDETLNWNNASSATLEVRHPSNNSLISSHSVYSANMPIRITIPNNLSGVTFNYIIHKKDTVGIPFKIHIGWENVNTSKNCYIAVNTFLTDQADSMRTNIAGYMYNTQLEDSWWYNYNGNVTLMKDNPYKKLVLSLFETSYTNPGSIEILATINGYAHPKVVWNGINMQEFHFNLTKDIYYDGRVNDVRIVLTHKG